jgi:hypothetical protein
VRTTFRIMKLERAPEGHWTARVVSGGRSITADTRHGSWQADVERNGEKVRADVRPEIAAALQRQVRRSERREARRQRVA